MALKDCVKKIGAALNKQDLDAIQKLIDGGTPEMEAVQYHLKKLEDAAKPDDVELVAYHNLSAENLVFAAKMGGLAVPSIAVTKRGQPHYGFGGITLIGTKEMVDPSITPVYDADAYSERFPDAYYKPVKTKAAQALIDSVRVESTEFDDHRATNNPWDLLVGNPDYGRGAEPHKAIQDMIHSDAWKAKFLREKGVDVKPVMRVQENPETLGNYPALKTFFKNNPSPDNWYNESDRADVIAWSAKFKVALREAIGQMAKKKSKGDPELEAVYLSSGEKFQGNYVDEDDGRLYFGPIERMERSMSDAGKQVVHSSKTTDLLNKKLIGKEAEFQKWVEDKVFPLVEEPLLVSGRKKIPYTLDNIVAHMAGKGMGAEKGLTFGEGSTRAVIAKRFKNYPELKKAAVDGIVHEEAVSAARKEAQDLSEMYRNKISPHTNARNHRGTPDTWEGLDGSMRAMARLLKMPPARRNADGLRAALRAEDFNVDKITDAELEIGVDAANALLLAPVPYFEAKPDRAVKLTEFVGAAIPKNAPQEVIDILNQHNIPYTTYGKTKELREKAINKFTDKLSKKTPGVLFQKAARNSLNLYSAVEQAVIDTKLPQWLKDQPAPGNEIWAKVSKTPGVKAEELDWMGLEDFLKSDPKAKFTRQQVLEFVDNNGVDVVEVTADEDGYDDIEFNWRSSEDTDESNYEHEAQAIADTYGTDEQDDELFKDTLNAVIAKHDELLNEKFGGNVMADNIIDWTSDEVPPNLWVVQKDMLFRDLPDDLKEKANANWKTWDMDKRRNVIDVGRDNNPNGKFKPEVVEYVKQHYADELKKTYTDRAWDKAYNNYMEDPFTVHTDCETDIVIEGNEAQGYRIIDQDGDVYREGIQGFNEAEIQARELIRPPEGSGNQKAKWGQYVMDGDHRNYRELKLTLPNIGGEAFIKGGHFDDPNIVAFLRVDDRDLMTGEVVEQVPARKVEYTIQVEDQYGRETVNKDDATLTMREKDGTLIGSARVLHTADHTKSIDELKAAMADPVKRKGVGRVLTFKRGYFIQDDGGITYEPPSNQIKSKNTYFIDEFQSDWHQAGRKQGYKIDVDVKALDEKRVAISKEVVKVTDSLWSNISKYTYIIDQAKHDDLITVDVDGGFTVIAKTELSNRIWSLLDGSEKMADVKQTHGPNSSTYQSYQFAQSVLEKATANGDIDLNDLTAKIKQATELEKMADTQRNAVPDAPFKGDAWLNLGLKRAIVDAVGNGYDAIAWPNANVLTERWSERYRTLYENQYDTKMPSAIKKLTGVQPKLMNADGEDLNGFNNSQFEKWLLDTGRDINDYPSNEIEILKKQFTDSNAQQGYWIIPLSKELKSKVKENSYPLFQPQDDKGLEYKRGAIQLLANNKRIIHLGENSDVSTLVHELAHSYLELEKQIANEFGISKNQQKLLDWLDVESFDDILTAHHEKYAETFEVYLETGKSPSPFLREAFANFRRWITDVYKVLKGRPNAHLTPEITEYFDRLLATEDEIEMMQANPVFDQFFRSKEQSGMTDAEWEKYQAQGKRVASTALATIDQKVIAELKKRKSDEWRDEKEPMIDEEKQRLSKLPVYQIMRDAVVSPMDYDAVIEAMGGAKLPGKLIGRAKKGGINPLDYAEAYGFPSVRGMIDTIVSSPALGQAADDAAQKRMIAKYGDILNDGSIEEEARKAIHSDEQAKLMLMELKALDKKTNLDRGYLESEARRMIAGMKYSEIKPDKYFKAEIRAAKKAVAAKTDAEKFEAKAQQIANHYLYRRALEIRDAMETQRKYVRGVQTRTYNPKEVDPSHVQNMKVLAKSYEMRKDDPQRPRNYEAILDWMVTQMQDENHYVQLEIVDINLAKALVDREMGKPVKYDFPTFDDMTADELQSLYDQLKHLRFVGGKMSENSKADLMISRANSAESISRNAKKIIPAQHERSALASVADSVVKFGFSHLRIRSIFNTLDGYEPGPMDKEYRLITDAFNKELVLTDKLAKSMDAAFKPVFKIINRRKQSTITKQDGKDWTLSHRARFVLGLNWGNEGNRVTLLEGLNNKFPDKYTEADVVKMLSTMSNPELQALNDVWDAKEALWPELSGAQVRIKGVAPPKIQATPFEINGIKLKGGHYRLHYVVDPADSGRKDISIEDNQRDSILMKTASSLNERVGSGGRQVDLELNHLFRDVQEDIHYIAFAEQAEHLNAMFKGAKNPVVAAITKGYGQPYYDNLVSTLDGFIHPAEPTTGLWKAMRYVRTNLTYAYLAFSVRNVVQQPVAITNTFSQLGTANTLAGALDFYSDPVGNWGKIREKSAFMRNRTELVNREATEQLSKIDSIHPIWGAIKKGAFMPQTFMDSLVAFPTWMGALRKFQLENPTASEAEGIRYADEMVVNTIGSGLSRDIGNILSGGEAEKQITFMGSFFNLTVNMHVDNYQLYKHDKISGFEYARRLGWMAVAPALLTAWMLDDLPDDEELLYLLKKVAFYNFSSVFMVRDLISAFDGFEPTIPGLQFGKGAVRVTKEMQGLITGNEEFDMNTIASIIRGVQPLAPLPGSGQVARTLEGMADDNQGAWGALVEGKERNQQ